MNGKTQSDKAPSKQPRITDKAHVIALALHNAGYGVGHSLIADTLLPRVIRPYAVKAARYG